MPVRRMFTRSVMFEANSTRWMPVIASALALAVSAGCGQYVSYGDEARPVTGETTPAPVITDIEDFPEVDHFNHYAFGGLVASFTSASDDGQYVYVDYEGLADDEEARYQLDTYLATLAGLDPGDLATRQGRLAYWINAYNATVIREVIAQFEGDLEFRVIDGGDFFTARSFAFGGVFLSLDQIEQGVIRGDFEHQNVVTLGEEELEQVRQWHEQLWEDGKIDARFHAAVNCGALGCPNLLATAPYVYQGDKLEEQLAEATARWLASEEKGAGPNGVSMLFTWYKQDFVDDAGSVEAFIEANREGGAGGVSLDQNIEYDWTLNAPQ